MNTRVLGIIMLVVGPLLMVPANDVDAAQEAMAIDVNGWRCGSIQQLNELDVQANDVVPVRVNNFSLRERDEYFGKARVIELSFSVANRGPKSLNIDAQMAGFDADQHLIFALHAQPTMSMVSEGRTDTATGSTYATPNDLKLVAKVCLKVMLGFK